MAIALNQTIQAIFAQFQHQSTWLNPSLDGLSAANTDYLTASAEANKLPERLTANASEGGLWQKPCWTMDKKNLGSNDTVKVFSDTGPNPISWYSYYKNNLYDLDLMDPDSKKVADLEVKKQGCRHP